MAPQSLFYPSIGKKLLTLWWQGPFYSERRHLVSLVTQLHYHHRAAGMCVDQWWRWLGGEGVMLEQNRWKKVRGWKPIRLKRVHSSGLCAISIIRACMWLHKVARPSQRERRLGADVSGISKHREMKSRWKQIKYSHCLVENTSIPHLPKPPALDDYFGRRAKIVRQFSWLWDRQTLPQWSRRTCRRSHGSGGKIR